MRDATRVCGFSCSMIMRSGLRSFDRSAWAFCRSLSLLRACGSWSSSPAKAACGFVFVWPDLCCYPIRSFVAPVCKCDHHQHVQLWIIKRFSCSLRDSVPIPWDVRIPVQFLTSQSVLVSVVYLLSTSSVLNYMSFDFFNIKFEHSSYLKNLYKHS